MCMLGIGQAGCNGYTNALYCHAVFKRIEMAALCRAKEEVAT